MLLIPKKQIKQNIQYGVFALSNSSKHQNELKNTKKCSSKNLIVKAVKNNSIFYLKMFCISIKLPYICTRNHKMIAA